MNTSGRCEECGTAIPTDSPGGFCAQCLLGLGLAKVSDEAVQSPESRVEVTGPLAEKPGDRIGRYRLLQEIGHGGCGVVYMAEQEKPVRRKVALKVIKLGMDTRQVVARFEAERQALALMDHSSIARVLDAGATDTGRPFFVMELVGGIKITDYCNQNQLTTRQRLDLFIQVCLAVQHAHQKGVIHRDLKPSNVLVAIQDGVPVPKVIDFGIAKATHGRLTNETLFTAFEQFLGTPAYMSPEQAQLGGLDVDTRSDIYSLGVLLYELLTGGTPFDTKELVAAGLDEMRRTIREVEPVKPSTRLTQELKSKSETRSAKSEIKSALRTPHSAIDRDLDWIVMKCLEKDRARRYETANGLVRDIERHWSNEPVVARPPSGAYRVQKFIRRNKLVATAVAAVSIVLTLGVSGVFWQWQRAEQHADLEHNERQRAEQATQRAQSALTQMQAIEVRRAEEYYEAGDRLNMLPYLALVLRQNPTNRLAAERLMSTLSHRTWARLACPPLEHSNRVTHAEFSRDGNRVTTSSADHTAWVWDAATGRRVAGPFRHEAEINTSVFSLDGRFVVTASQDKTARVWDALTGQPITSPLQHSNDVFTAHFNPAGTLVLTASGSLGQLWNVRTGQRAGPALVGGSELRDAQFSPDGSLVALACRGGQAQVWEVASGVCRHRFEHASNVWSAAFSPDGNWLVTASADNTARVWDLETGLPTSGPLEHQGSVRGAAFSPGCERIVTVSSDHTAQIWDARTGQKIGPPLKHAAEVRSALFSPAGLRVTTASGDDTVRVWDALTGEPLTEPLVHEANAFSAEFDPHGERLLTASNGKSVTIWDISPATALRLHGEVRAWLAAFSPNGTRVVVGDNDGTIRICDALTGEALTVRKQDGSLGVVNWAEFSPDGGSLVAGDNAGRCGVWNPRTGQPLARIRGLHNAPIVSARFSHDGRNFVTDAWDGSARVWDALTGEPGILFLHKSRPIGAEFSADDKCVLTAAANSVAGLWDVGTGRLVQKFRHEADVNSAHFSPDGTRVLTASRDMSARVWDAQTGALLGTLQHPSFVFSARFSRDNRLIVTAFNGDAHTLQVWDAQTFKPLTEPFGDGTSPEFDPAGERLIGGSAHNEKTVRIWDARTGLRLSEELLQGAVCQFSHFSPDGRFILLATDQYVQIREVPPALLPVPGWLSGLAEALAGQRFSQQGVLEPVRPAELWVVQQKMAAWAMAQAANVTAGISPAAVPGIPRSGTAARPRSELTPSAIGDNSHGKLPPSMSDRSTAVTADAFYARWAKWFLANALTRTVLPCSPLTLPEYAGQLDSPTEALRLQPNNGLHFMRLVDLDPWSPQADWWSRRATELLPESFDSWWSRGCVLMRTDRLTEALQMMQRASERAPTNAWVWRDIGTILEMTGRLEDAWTAFTKAIEVSGDLEGGRIKRETLLQRYDVLKRLGRYAEAEADWLKAVSIPEYPASATEQFVDLISELPNGAARAPPGPGFALRFSDIASYVAVPDTAGLNAFPLTVMAWVNTTAGRGQQGLVNKYVSGSHNGWNVFLHYGHVRAWYFVNNTRSVWGGWEGLDGGFVADGGWHHIAFTVDASGGRLYVDGLLRASRPWTGAAGASTTTQEVRLGNSPGGIFSFNGSFSLDEITVWRVALSQKQIVSNQFIRLTGNQADLVALYRCEEGSGSSVADTAPLDGSNNGVWVGTPRFEPTGVGSKPQKE